MNIHEEHGQMVKQLAKDGQAVLDSMSAVQMHRLHMAIGVAGELAELVEAMQEINEEMVTAEEGLENLKEEAGDAFFYLTGYIQSIVGDIALPQYKRFEIVEDIVTTLIVSSGKLLDAAKRDGIYQKENPTQQAIVAIRDVYKNLMYVLDLFDITEEQAKEHNLNKLLKGKNARYASGSYSDQQANERADKK